MSLEGKVALVTGAGGVGSIGRAIAGALAGAGAAVLLTDIETPPDRVSPREAELGWRGLDDAVAHIRAAGGDAAGRLCDLADPAAITDLVSAAIGRFGRLHVVVNAARAHTSQSTPGVGAADVADWDLAFAVNVRAPMLLSRLAARHMLEAGIEGTIINISSSASRRPEGMVGAYATSKAALNMLTRVMALELAPHRIRVNAICPGLVSSSRVFPAEIAAAEREGIPYEVFRARSIAEQARSIPLRRAGTPAEIAAVALFLASEASSYMTGQCLNVDGGVVME